MNPLLVFDLDGTLIDSAPDIVTAMNRTLQNNGKAPLSDAKIISHIGEGLKKLLSDLFVDEPLSVTKLVTLENEFLSYYETEMLNKTSIYAGVETFLESYRGPIAIITNKNEAPARKILTHLNLHRFPWVNIFGADSLAERKPSPVPLQTMMKLAGHDNENTIMIGDGIPDIVSAQSANVASIAVDFGYTDLNTLKKYKPDGILSHYSDLHGLIRQLFMIE